MYDWTRVLYFIVDHQEVRIELYLLDVVTVDAWMKFVARLHIYFISRDYP